MYNEDDSYQDSFEDPYQEPFQEPCVESDPEREPGPETTIISTSQAINLTSTLASLSALIALFLCFADQRSQAVRRFSVQSVGLGAVQLALGMVCWIIGALLGWIPLIGYWLYILMVIVFFAGSAIIFILRIRMMFHAYRGEAFLLPVIGATLRRFE